MSITPLPRPQMQRSIEGMHGNDPLAHIFEQTRAAQLPADPKAVARYSEVVRAGGALCELYPGDVFEDWVERCIWTPPIVFTARSGARGLIRVCAEYRRNQADKFDPYTTSVLHEKPMPPGSWGLLARVSLITSQWVTSDRSSAPTRPCTLANLNYLRIVIDKVSEAVKPKAGPATAEEARRAAEAAAAST